MEVALDINYKWTWRTQKLIYISNRNSLYPNDIYWKTKPISLDAVLSQFSFASFHKNVLYKEMQLFWLIGLRSHWAYLIIIDNYLPSVCRDISDGAHDIRLPNEPGSHEPTSVWQNINWSGYFFINFKFINIQNTTPLKLIFTY